MKGKVCMVTGASAGIGWETAKGLAAKGATVVMVVRNAQKSEPQRAEIVKLTGNPNVEMMSCDLASQQSIRQLAADFRAKHDRLDVLVNNAGTFVTTYQESPEGIELQFAVNHIGYFLLTNLLLDLMEKSAPARIVNVSSSANYNGRIYFDILRKQKKVDKYDGLKAYSQSKLANVLFTKELARRYPNKNIIANCLHPGVVRTQIGNKNSKGFYHLLWQSVKPFMITAEKGARTSIYLASSPEVAQTSGEFFIKCKSKKPNPVAEDPKMAKELWDLSLEMTEMQ